MRRHAIGPVVAALLAVTACNGVPRDPERTEELVRETRTIRLGWVDGAATEPEALAALAKVARATGATIERRGGDSEALLGELEDGKIDLVYGHFADDSPWAKMVHLGYALGWRATPPKHVEVPRFVMRNGENGWIMRVERAVKQ